MGQSLEQAAAALAQYSLQVKSVDFVGQSASSVFKVTDTEQNTYSLRFHESKSGNLGGIWTEPAVIQSEMAWLHALAEETGLTAPVPCRNKNGEWVTDHAGTPCTLLGWVEGEQRPIIWTGEEAEQIGEMIGKLHRQASSWNPPPGFVRPVFDGIRVSDALEKIKALAGTGLITDETAAVISAAGQRVIGMMASLHRNPGTWGIIHADLIPSNVVFHQNECRPIDFGACGFGYFLIDLGWTFSYIHPSLRRKLLDAYSGVFGLPEDYVELLEGFFVAAQLETMNFWLGLPDATEWLPEHLKKLAAREFGRYVSDEPFLFQGSPYWE